ncbi:MAG: histidine--tRNA ligase [Planctomycetota bacterium]|jgi:histidyl-tRNA synthetase
MTERRITPRIFKGMRDLLPDRMRVRNTIIERLRSIFESYGFEPLETPAFEFYDIEEADHLLYPLAYNDGRTLALRYDLTVPLSRVVAMYGKSMLFPFRRYQIQRVWRAEKPQRGRYREILQCDVDTVGTASMAADAEIILLACDGMRRLGFQKFQVELNNRKLINGLYTALGIPAEKHVFVSRTVDKIQKIGPAEVRQLLVGNEDGDSIPEEIADPLLETLAIGTLDAVEARTAASPEGREGAAEIREILELVGEVPEAAEAVRFTPAMVRGLDYYTGPIFEVVVEEPKIGSLGGGGRYDGLVALFSGEKTPATGFSFGMERLMDILQDDEDALGGPGTNRPADALVTVFAPNLLRTSMGLADELRAAGIRAEVFLGSVKKIGKQLDYANRRRIPVVLILGPDEAAAGNVTVKWMAKGKQETLGRETVPQRIREALERMTETG